MIKRHENIKQAKSDFKKTNSKFLSVFDKGSWREHGRVLIIHEGHEGGYMNNILQGSKISFQDFHLQGRFQACPVFTPDDYIMGGLKVKLNLVLKFFPQ